MILRVNVSFVVLVLPFILSQFAFALPVAKCRLCKECEENLNSTRKLTTTTRVNQTDLSDRNETDELISAVLGTENVTRVERSFFSRSKRQSFVEKKPCPNRFQLELVLIPLSILAIPLVLLCFLLCACFCGRKEERARFPEVWYLKKHRKRHDTADDLYFGTDYVKRKSSQKTRFQTKVTIIERRRESALTVASNGPPEPDDRINQQQTTNV